jgi:hypothetical protein
MTTDDFRKRRMLAALSAMLALAGCESVRPPPADPAARAVYEECDAVALRAVTPGELFPTKMRNERRATCMLGHGVAP